MDFKKILTEHDDKKNQTYNPYAGKRSGEWIEGAISLDFLNEKFGEYETATEMKDATNSEGLKKFFDHLVEEGKIPE